MKGISMRQKLVWGLGIAVLLFTVTFAQQPDSTLQLEPLIQEALQNNPDLKAAGNAWKSAEAQISAAGALPDPVLGINMLNLPVNTFKFDQEPMTGKQISLMQAFPFPGKQGLRSDIAREGAKASQMQYAELRDQLVKNVKSVYYELFYADKGIETAEKNEALLKEFSRIAETRYQVGKGLQQDVLKAQLQLLKVDDQLINLRQRRETLAAQLNTLLNRAPETPVGKPVVAKTVFLHAGLDSLKNLADGNRPLLKSWAAVLGQSSKKVDLAKKGYLPDFSLGAAYTQRDVLENGSGGVDFLSGTFSVSLPVYFWKKQKKNVEENRFNELSVQQRYESVRRQVYRNLQTSLTDLQKNGKRLKLYEEAIIPQASQTLQSALSAYQVDKVDFLTLVDSQMMLFNYELEYYRAVADYHKNLADLEAQTGANLTGTE
ncbi:MAG: TolC family protein [Calditrichia bacterium]